MFHRLTPDLVIRSPWRPFRFRPAEQSLVLAGGSAFPPNHPTTRLCLDLLKTAVALRPLGPALDIGCGSGILALAALSLGVPWAVAVDISGRAVRQTEANARRNHLLLRLGLVQGSTECLRGGFKDTQVEPLLTGYQVHGWSVLNYRSRDSWAPEPPPDLSYTWVAWLLGRVAPGNLRGMAEWPSPGIR